MIKNNVREKMIDDKVKYIGASDLSICKNYIISGT